MATSRSNPSSGDWEPPSSGSAAAERVDPGAELRVVGAAIVEGRRVLAARRGPGMSLAGKWELPGGKIEAGEDASRALVREIREELGVDIEVGRLLGIGRAGRVRLEVYAARAVSGRPSPREHSALRWLTPGELGELDWAAADRPVLAALRELLEEGER